LIPESETSFHWYDGTAVNFSLDAAGTVTGFRRVFGYSGESGFYVKR
jgi:hypothetical protein